MGNEVAYEEAGLDKVVGARRVRNREQYLVSWLGDLWEGRLTWEVPSMHGLVIKLKITLMLVGVARPR